MAEFPPVEEQLAQIRRGVEEILPEDALAGKLQRSRASGKPLVVKLGCDPSRPDLHLGHSVVLRKLRQFQDLGHQAVLIVGDFTGMIGDPSGRSKTRPALTLDETRENGRTYFEQASRILDPERTQMRFNSDWLSPMTFEDVIKLAGRYTVARMLERDEFEKRYRAGEPISVHEFLYPLAQAQDSVAIESDIELGGTDQKFNLLVGRAIQQSVGQDAQVCITLPILEGTDGIEKMSKSLDNYVGISEPPEEMYGKLLSIPDRLIYRYFELVTDVPTAELEQLRVRVEEDPRNTKHELAWSVVRMYHGEQAADDARAHFERTIVRREIPDEMPTHEAVPENGSVIGLLTLLSQANLAASNSEARRLVQQGAVSIDGERVGDPAVEIDLAVSCPFVVKVGKRRFARISYAGR